MESITDNSSQSNGNSDVEPKTSSLLLLSLNMDCLLKIFDYLYIYDTVNLAWTCKTFMIVARQAVKKYKKFELTEHHECCIEQKNGYNDLCRYTARLKPKKVLQLAPILYIISPYVESINLHPTYSGSSPHYETVRHLVKKLKFPKMKTLTVKNSSVLQWLNVDRIEELKIRQVDQHELGNYAHGMRKLKKLSIGDISRDVSMVEIYHFLERNPHIECFKLKQVLPFDFKMYILPRLRHLRELQLTFGKIVPDLTDLLRIEQLSILRLKFVDSFSLSTRMNNYSRMKLFLKNLSAKKTIETIDLSGMLFMEFEVIKDFSEHLVSLRLIDSIIRVDGFYWQLANAPFLRLKHLDIGWISYTDAMSLIEHLQTLERIVMHNTQGNTPEFLEQLKLLMGHESRTNNAFELALTTKETVKYVFHRGQCEVQTTGRCFFFGRSNAF